jgi:hypothetical protein
MLTHVNKVIYKLICKMVGEKTKAKKVTGSDRTLASGAPARPVSSGRDAAKGFSERTLATVHRRIRCMVGRQRTQGTGRVSSASGANDVSAWRGRVITGRWGASDRPPANASGARFLSLVPY